MSEVENKIIRRFVRPLSDYQEGGGYFYQVVPLDVQAFAIYPDGEVRYVFGDEEHTYLEIKEGKGTTPNAKEYPVVSDDVLNELKNSIVLEGSRAVSAENFLQQNLSNEEKRAKEVEQTLQTNIIQEIQRAQGVENSLNTQLTGHIDNKNNPHSVTKAQIGLENVNNTSDADKPISIATQNALNLKANFSEVYTKAEVDAKVASVYKFKGSVPTYNDLPTKDLTAGDVYNVIDTGANYGWTGTEWDDLGRKVDLTPYLEKAEAENIYVKKVDYESLLQLVNNLQKRIETLENDDVQETIE